MAINKSILKATATIEWNGEVAGDVRALSPVELLAVLASLGDDIAGVFAAMDEFDKIDFANPDKGAIADRIMLAAPTIMALFKEHFPNLLARIIAAAADEPEEWEYVRDNYDAALQFYFLAEICRVTFHNPDGFRRFVGNVLALSSTVRELSVSATAKNKKPPSHKTERPSSVDG